MRSTQSLSSLHIGRTHLDGLDNVLIPCAAAQIAFELLANLSLIGVGVASAQIDRTHDHAWRAKPALQAMTLFERSLHGVQCSILLSQTLDGGDV